MGSAGLAGRSRRSMGAGARSRRRGARGAHRQRSRRRGIGRAGGCAASFAFVGFFMLDPTAPDAPSRTEHALDRLGLRAICLFPAMQRYSLHDPRVREIVQLAAAHAGHGGLRALRRAVGRRAKEAGAAKPLRRALRQSARSARAGRRLSRRAVHHSALRRGTVSRSAARRRPLPERVPRHVEHQPVDGVPPTGSRWPTCSGRRSRLPGRSGCLFGTDSSFFPRGWNRAVYDAQVSALDAAGVDESVRQRFSTAISTGYFPPKRALTGRLWCYDRVNSQGERHGLRTGVHRRPIGADQHHPGHPKTLAPEARRARRRVRRRAASCSRCCSRHTRSRRSSSAPARSSPSASAW